MQEKQMKILRQLCAAFALTLTLALSAFAGEIQIPFAPPPPPTQQAATAGEVSAPGAGEMQTGVTATTEIALNLIQGVLALL
jgi:hypothetical protein